MASNIKAPPEKNMRIASEKLDWDIRDLPQSPLEFSNAAVRELIRSAMKRGYVTVNQINVMLSSETVKSEQIEDIMPMFSEMGIEVIQTEKTEPEGEGELVEVARAVSAESEAKEPAERTDDPVRMYLREMSSVKLLSREGEIAIAKC